MVYTNIIKYKASIGYYKCKQVIGREALSKPIFSHLHERPYTDATYPTIIYSTNTKTRSYIAYEINQSLIHITHYNK